MSQTPLTPHRPLHPEGPDEVARELIDGRIQVHDRQHFEVKLDYALDPARRRNRYRVEAYFFTPLSLGITAETYTKQRFFNDIQAYIRFKTPAVPLAALLANGDGVLADLERCLPGVARGALDRAGQDRAGQDMRLLGCLVRAHVRDRVAWICAGIEGLDAAAGSSQAVEDLGGESERLLAETAALLGRFRALRRHLLDPAAPARVRETHEWVDEYLSLTVEGFLSRLLQILDGRPGLLPGVRAGLRDAVVAEQDHRSGAGHPSGRPDDGGTLFLFRRGLLKKFVMGVLFLEITKDPQADRRADLLAALAAGAAMLVASVGGLWAQQRYMVTTWPFLAAIVLLYMVKDRIKEWLRTFLTRKLSRFLADHSERIRDPHLGLDLGRCREAFTFLRPGRVPPEVAALRHQDARAGIEPDAKPETVFRYEKEVTLDGTAVRRLGGLRPEINDILRFSVAPFLLQADDPEVPVRVYRRGSDRVEEVPCPKVYHLNLVFVLRAEDDPQPPTMGHVRVVLDRRGIRALEHRA